VTLRIRNLETGEESTLQGAALIAADGATSSIRKLLQMPMHGTPKIAHFINCYFKADVEQYARQRPGILLFVSNDEASGVLQPLDAQGRWLCQISVPEDQWDTAIFTHERCTAWVRAAVGVDSLAVDIVSVGTWEMNALVAESFLVGNVLLMGDAAHMFPPSGGLGVNTGLQGMHNVIWKLALYLRGKAGRQLLETYTSERRPYAEWVAEQTFHNARQVEKIALITRGLAPATITPAEVMRETRRYGNQLGIELGSIYESRAIVPDDTRPPEVDDAYTDYVPTARPGHRAPHVWLKQEADTLSTLNLFGPEFTVLVGADDGSWSQTVLSMRAEHGLDIGYYKIGKGGQYADANPTANGSDFLQKYSLESSGAVLVRPDGYVAWRCKKYNDDAPLQLRDALTRILA